MKIEKAIIVRGRGADKVALHTDLPEATWPFKDPLTLHFDCAIGQAEHYLDAYFPGIEVKVVYSR